SAFLAIASTTKILVNEVIISSSAGATDSSVMPSSVMMDDDGVPSGPLISTLTPPEPPGAAGSAGASTGAAWLGDAPRIRKPTTMATSSSTMAAILAKRGIVAMDRARRLGGALMLTDDPGSRRPHAARLPGR